MNKTEQKLALDAANLLRRAAYKLERMAHKKSPEAEQPGKSEECASRGKDRITADKRAKVSKWNVPELIEAYKSGRTLEELGQEHGVTRERIRQKLAEAGITRADGGAHRRLLINAEINAPIIQARLEAKAKLFLERTGMTKERWIEVRAGVPWKQSPQRAFMEQKRNMTRLYASEWLVNFADWWQEWVDSGKWSQRGLGAKKYCMTRHDKTKPWQKGNLRVDTLEVICSDTIHETLARRRLPVYGPRNRK